MAVGLAVEQQPARGRERAAALPDRIGHLLLPDDLVGAGIDGRQRAGIFRADAAGGATLPLPGAMRLCGRSAAVT